LLATRGGLIANIDITIVAEAPKIAPHVAAMRERLSAILGIKGDRIGIKATTSETLGFTGRREGLVAMATATVRLPWGS
jgi:2-C-methyl-D-erythritol 4-phosphate cytidylyltransferase / 2-C-methyl-D-erythritol 2,4-cyclodiphosphate synthase